MSNTNINGGPAFPHCSRCGENANQRGGPLLAVINLRDYFAAKALQGLLSNSEVQGTPHEFAERAYSMANAMLRVRGN